MKGQVKWFNLKKGYGFITGEDGKDYFFHYSVMPQGVLLKEGDSVNFEASNTDKGLQAKDITKGDASAIEEPIVSEQPTKEPVEPIAEEPTVPVDETQSAEEAQTEEPKSEKEESEPVEKESSTKE